MCAAIPSPAMQEALLSKYNVPSEIAAHGKAVAQCALEMAAQLPRPVDVPLMEAACCLHDIARGQPDHARAGGVLLIQEGFPDVGNLVAQHHDLPEDANPEASLLYLADKLVRGTCRVTLEERFAASLEKCATPEALSAWQRRRDRAFRIVRDFQLSL